MGTSITPKRAAPPLDQIKGGRRGAERTGALRHQPGDPVVRRGHDDAGVGMFSSLLGVFAMLAFLFLAAQLLIGLYATSVVTATAFDAANRAARLDPAAADNPEIEILRIENHARNALGPMGNDADFRWTVTDNEIRLRIAADPPAFVPSSLSRREWRAVTREAVVRRERLIDLVDVLDVSDRSDVVEPGVEPTAPTPEPTAVDR